MRLSSPPLSSSFFYFGDGLLNIDCRRCWIVDDETTEEEGGQILTQDSKGEFLSRDD
jgi:hypothetical protein